jgi:OOP family OmpA-OmpF porin
MRQQATLTIMVLILAMFVGAPLASSGAASSEDMTLYTKYDFVPGDKAIFHDDFATEEVGEFPSRWRLDSGVFEVVARGGRNFVMCTDTGGIRPRIARGPLPAAYTIEMEFVVNPGEEVGGHWFYLKWYDAEDNEIGSFSVTENVQTDLWLLDDQLADKDLPNILSAGIHTMRVMATATTMKCYVDNERVANVPAVDGFAPEDIGVWMNPYTDEPANPMLIGAFRYAEGGKPLRQQLDETGRIVSHGVLFDTGSATIRGESYKTLANIGQLLTDDPTLRLSIEGHTDSDGSEESNLALSESRAAAVRAYLMETYGVGADRLEAKGWGEATPIDTNATAEGKANNRRVEFVKL